MMMSRASSSFSGLSMTERRTPPDKNGLGWKEAVTVQDDFIASSLCVGAAEYPGLPATHLPHGRMSRAGDIIAGFWLLHTPSMLLACPRELKTSSYALNRRGGRRSG